MSQYYTGVTLLTLCSVGILAFMVKGNNVFPRHKKYGLYQVFLLIALVAAAEWVGVYLDGKLPGPRTVQLAARAVEYTLSPFIPITCAASMSSLRKVRWTFWPLGLHALLEVLSVHSGLIFRVDRNNLYHRGTGYCIYLAAMALGMAVLVWEWYRLSGRYQNRSSHVMVMILLLVMLGGGMQVAKRYVQVAWLTAALATLLYYIYFSELLQQMDAVTGLLNRRSYESHLSGLKKPAVVLILDVDRFKQVNDTYGHAYGDCCLSEVGAQMRAAYEKYGYCFRVGGDEFSVVLERPVESIEALNSSFFHLLELQRRIDPHLPNVSVGYAAYDPKRDDLHDILAHADQMMYEFKENSRSRIV